MKFIILLTISSCIFLSACSKDKTTTAQSNNGGGISEVTEKHEKTNGTEETKKLEQSAQSGAVLEVYEGNNFKANEIRALNTSEKKLTFDYSYVADQDETLTLTNLKDNGIIGCDDAHFGFQFSLYHLGQDGKIDLSGYEGIGPAPTKVKQGEQYVVRVTLTLDKSCTALGFDFGIQANH